MELTRSPSEGRFHVRFDRSSFVAHLSQVRMASFSQHHVDGLDLAATPLGYLMKQFPGVPDQRLRGHLGSFGITGPLALQTMYTLSGEDTWQWIISRRSRQMLPERNVGEYCILYYLTMSWRRERKDFGSRPSGVRSDDCLCCTGAGNTGGAEKGNLLPCCSVQGGRRAGWPLRRSLSPGRTSCFSTSRPTIS